MCLIGTQISKYAKIGAGNYIGLYIDTKELMFAISEQFNFLASQNNWPQWTPDS